MQVLPCTLHWSKIANMSGDQQQCYRARRRAACLLWLYAAVLQVPPRSPGPWHLQTPTLCHTAALSWFRGTARGLWRLPLGSYQISYQGNLSFFLRRRNTNLSSPWILYIDIKTYKEKFCTQDLFINLLYGTLILWRSYEGWDLSSSIKGLFYYQHVDCGYYCVACRCIVCGHCSSHQPTDQRRQDCRLQERSPCCRAAVSVTWLLQPPAVHYEVFT